MDNQTEGNYYQPYRPEDPAPARLPGIMMETRISPPFLLSWGSWRWFLYAVSLLYLFPSPDWASYFPAFPKQIFPSRTSQGRSGDLQHSAGHPDSGDPGFPPSPAIMIASPTGRNFLQDYMDLITSDRLTEQDLYNFNREIYP